MRTEMHNIAGRAVLPVIFNKKIGPSKSIKAKVVFGIFGKRFLDFGAANNPHKVVAVRGNSIIRKYFVLYFLSNDNQNSQMK